MKFSPATFLFAVILLAACGGGGGITDVPSPSPEPPPSLSQDRLQALSSSLISQVRATGLPVAEETALINELSELENAIRNLEDTLAALTARVRELENELRTKVATLTPCDPRRGERRINGDCTVVCEAGKELIDGACVYLPCATGLERVGDACVTACLPGQQRTGGICNDAPCGTGLERVAGACVPVCLPGQQRTDGICEYPSCDAGKERISGICVPVCEPGRQRVGDNCVLTNCNTGEERIGGVCVPVCNTGEERINGACVAACLPGQQRTGGVCEYPRGATRICEYSFVGFNRPFNEEIPANEDCEYYANWGLNAMNTRYAYTKGYFGQGVTVFTDEFAHIPSHADLTLNSITGPGDSIRGFQAHGLAMHGIIAAERNGIGMHGVAPQAKVVLQSFISPVRNILADATDRLYQFSLEPYIGTVRGNRVRIELPRVPMLWDKSGLGRDQKSEAQRIALEWGDTDRVYVIAAGNDGGNTENGIRGGYINPDVICRQSKEIDPNCNNTAPFPENNGFYYHPINELTSFVDERYGALATMTVSPFSSSYTGFFAIVHPELQDNFIVVVAVERNLTIASFSDQCGSEKNWCVAAPGENTLAPGIGGVAPNFRDTFSRFGGTSGASAHVGGALAVLKSAAPKLPMTIIQPILLSTATDLGKPGIDEVYGRGIVNISAALVQIENMKTARTSQFAPVSYFALRGALPAQFSHLHKHLQNAQIAVEVFDGMYYNMPLSRMFSAAAENTAPEMGEAAAKMLSEIPESKSAKGFFAFGASQNEFGVRWRGKTGGLRFLRGFQELGFLPNGADIMAEMSHAAADGAFSGAHLGALGAASGSSNGGKIRLGGNIKGNLSAFGEYEYRDISGRLSGGVLQTEIKGAESSGWTAGMEYADIGMVGSRLRLSASRRAELSGGEIVLHYPKAAGDNFREVFFGEGKQEIKAAATAIPLARRAPILWTIGYAVEADGGGEWSAAVEYDTGSKKSALSAKWRLEF